MKPLLKYTKDYLLLIDPEAKIYQMDFYLDVDCDAVTRATLASDQYSGCKKIIAYYPLTEGAKELDLPLLPNPFKKEENIEKIAYNWLYDEKTETKAREGYPLKPMEYGFIEGYKLAQSKQFSLEDVKKAIQMAKTLVEGKQEFEIENILGSSDGTHGISEKYTEEEIIQSLSTQKLPVSFEPEYVGGREYLAGVDGVNEIWAEYPKELKTITNSEGKEELVGTYKF